MDEEAGDQLLIAAAALLAVVTVTPPARHPAVEAPAVEWITVTAPNGSVMKAAVARPQGQGPFPALLILHGTHGFGRQYVELAQDLARSGIVGVAACWFKGGSGAGTQYVTPIDCPGAQAMPEASQPAASEAIEALVQAVRALPGVRPDRVALFGHSRGAGAVLRYVMSGTNAFAAVLHSGGYPDEIVARAADVKVPLLIEQGTADGPTGGGSTFTKVQRARLFEHALRRAGKRVETSYYRGGIHNGFFADVKQRAVETGRIVAFLTGARGAPGRRF